MHRGMRTKPAASREDETLAERKKRRELASRGKNVEGLVQNILTEWRVRDPNFDFDRLLDSKAAKAIVAAQVSDFLIFFKGRSATLEVKKKQKGTRLSKGSFPQHPRMLRRELAGCRGFLIAFTEETNEWWVVRVTSMEKGLASWDLTEVGKKYPDALDALSAIKLMLVP